MSMSSEQQALYDAAMILAGRIASGVGVPPTSEEGRLLLAKAKAAATADGGKTIAQAADAACTSIGRDWRRAEV